MKGAGRDGTNLFMEVHPWVNWENMLGACLVGVLVPEDYAKSELEDMDEKAPDRCTESYQRWSGRSLHGIDERRLHLE